MVSFSRRTLLHGVSNTEFSFQGRTMSQSVSRRPLTAEAHFHSLGSRCGLCGVQDGAGTVSFLERFFPPFLILYDQFSIVVFSLILSLSEGQRGECWEICNKSMLFRVSGSVVQNLSSSYVFGFRSSILIFLSSFGVLFW